jgi:wobble nucleotide-excising tRNase
MIKNISKIKDIARFSNFSQTKDFQFGSKGQNCNIIFGFNGSGKTTLSNSFSFFSNESFLTEEEKSELFNDLKNTEDSIIELELQGNAKIKYPADSAHSKEIYIFNHNFIAAHVFNGTKGKIRKFSNIGGEIKNKDIDRINEQIEQKTKDKELLETENKELDAKHQTISKTKSKEFCKTLTDKNKKIIVQNLSEAIVPTETLENLEAQLKSLSADYELSKKQVELQADIAEIKTKHFNTIQMDIPAINQILGKNVQRLSKEVLKKKIELIQDSFEDVNCKQSVERWFRFGKNILDKLKAAPEVICPICNTNITQKVGDILQDYERYFDETYESFIAELEATTAKVSVISETIKTLKNEIAILEKIYQRYHDYLTQVTLEKLDFSVIETKIEELRELLKAKGGNIQKCDVASKDVEKNLIALNDYLTKAEILKANILTSLESKTLNTNEIEDLIRITYKEIILLEFDQTIPEGAIAKYKSNCSIVKKMAEETIPELKSKLATELKKIKAESKSISKYLNKMGISHFEIDINDANEDENIIIRYGGSSRERNKLKNSLSEGEKTALAFAFFLSKFENEVNSEEKIKNSAVVIDDPISSLDENRLYSTAYLIYKTFEEAKQLIVMSHNFLFLKYFNSFYYGKAECFFLDKNKISDLPEEMKNFETPYFYMLRTLFDYLDATNTDVTYNEVKRYLPNYTRRILETFLSFKFSAYRSSRSKNFSPGLEELAERLDETTIEDGQKRALKDKLHVINQISKAHSHGNANHMQENFYISEEELTTLAQNAVFVIETMDNLHKTSFIEGGTKNSPPSSSNQT